MATNDVPGANPANHDRLAMGCWAEHEDGSLVFVESVEANRVVYSLFDLAQSPVLEYRDAMPEDGFKRSFSWSAGKPVAGVRWTWHDKTPFPWDRVIVAGAKPGPRYASAEDQISAAQRVAEALRLRAQAVKTEDLTPKAAKRVMRLAKRLEKALAALPDQPGA